MSRTWSDAAPARGEKEGVTKNQGQASWFSILELAEGGLGQAMFRGRDTGAIMS